MAELIKACIFDAYGTLLDVHTPIQALLVSQGEKADAISKQWRAKQLEYTWLRSLMGRYTDFARITADALDYVLAAHAIDDSTLRERLLDQYHALKSYDDASLCFETVKAHGCRTAILSNGSPSMLAAAVEAAGIKHMLDGVLSVETVQIYKPSHQVYQFAADSFDLMPNAIAFVSANSWDCAGASSFGFQVIYVDRTGQGEDRLDAPAVARVRNLTEASAILSDMLADRSAA